MTAENSLDRKVVWVESECLHVPPNSIVAAFFCIHARVVCDCSAGFDLAGRG